MRVEPGRWNASQGWQWAPSSLSPQLVLAFGDRRALELDGPLAALRTRYPGARLLGCSTAGEISGTEVTDDQIVATAVQLDSTTIRLEQTSLADSAQSARAAGELGRRLASDDLVHVFVLSDGLGVNGSELVRGLAAELPKGVAVTGALAGDGERFERTVVCVDGAVRAGAIAAVGFYGKRLRVGFGSVGGWDPFGPERYVTRARGNVLWELDGQPALALYKRYLGQHAADLPASGLLFPLALRADRGDPSVVRTILGVNEAEQSITFAGDVPPGSYVRLMKANFERLIDGATGAAQASAAAWREVPPQLALLVSCVGRRLVLKQRIEEELEAVRDVLGAPEVQTGFYSYGEIAPFVVGGRCELHNQTMTITTLREV